MLWLASWGRVSTAPYPALPCSLAQPAPILGPFSSCAKRPSEPPKPCHAVAPVNLCQVPLWEASSKVPQVYCFLSAVLHGALRAPVAHISMKKPA